MCLRVDSLLSWLRLHLNMVRTSSKVKGKASVSRHSEKADPQFCLQVELNFEMSPSLVFS